VKVNAEEGAKRTRTGSHETRSARTSAQQDGAAIPPISSLAQKNEARYRAGTPRRIVEPATNPHVYRLLMLPIDFLPRTIRHIANFWPGQFSDCRSGAVLQGMEFVIAFHLSECGLRAQEGLP
jgi:hypothetical protein